MEGFSLHFFARLLGSVMPKRRLIGLRRSHSGQAKKPNKIFMGFLCMVLVFAISDFIGFNNATRRVK